MAKEIERKFLVKDDSWRQAGGGTLYRQGYICGGSDRVVRVRMCGNHAFLTIKRRVTQLARQEFEYKIPLADAEELLNTCCSGAIIEKTRYNIEYAGHLWEIDEFAGANQGLVIAEIELRTENQQFARPAWVGKEVSDDPRYFNANLVKNPFSAW